MTFLCDYIHVISRTNKDPFAIRYSIPLGGGEIITRELLVEKKKPPSIFIGNLDPNTNEEDIRNLFYAHGFTTKSVNIIRHQDSGKSKGFGFVTIEENLQESISTLSGQTLNGRPIRVNESN
eukprot:TRINITY_DN3859_c0_g1_i1.p1 TRINITY_DN3859_c0_g1~~TRINITY_DN3859_c0_g1_i1.p1  ORF type:complete len:122 (+),score=16.16 TRINITY_DN3859_c0_g1_i1:100-465(+)